MAPALLSDQDFKLAKGSTMTPQQLREAIAAGCKTTWDLVMRKALLEYEAQVREEEIASWYNR